MINTILIWLFCIFIPILLLKHKFRAIFILGAFLIFFTINDIYYMIINDNMLGLLQTVFNINKTTFIIYESCLILFFVALLFMAYKKPKFHTIIFIYLTLCNALYPFSILEKLLFGKSMGLINF